MHSFLLIGQSNMAGRGHLDEVHEINTSRIFTLRNGHWRNMFRPINPDDASAGVNLAESFAEQYAQTYNVDVGLICCAVGNTKLSMWQPGEPLFDNAVNQAKLAKRTSEIKGILWHQGEADCSNGLYLTYESRFYTMMHEFKNQLDLHNIPFILGGLGDFLEHCPLDANLKNYIHINAALKNIAASTEFAGFVPADELTPNPDMLHFNSESLYQFGLRYFAEYEKLTE